jgi:hypothetical protein
VTTPAVGEMPEVAEVYTTSFGVRRFVWLRMLKNSARNCNPKRSVICEFLVAEKSTSDSPGPFNESRETLPKVPVVGGRNAAGLKYCSQSADSVFL